MMSSREKRKGLTAMDLACISVCTVLIAVCSWVSIPAMVPFTLQTFAVFCVPELIGGKRGTLSIVVYILLAAMGIPVLHGFSGGPGAVLGTTGGYLLGFVLIGLVYWLNEKLFGTALPARIAAMLLGLFLCYAFGTAWFMAVYARNSGPVGLDTALAWCVVPFILPDLAKLALALLLASRLRRVIRV